MNNCLVVILLLSGIQLREHKDIASASFLAIVNKSRIILPMSASRTHQLKRILKSRSHEGELRLRFNAAGVRTTVTLDDVAVDLDVQTIDCTKGVRDGTHQLVVAVDVEDFQVGNEGD